MKSKVIIVQNGLAVINYMVIFVMLLMLSSGCRPYRVDRPTLDTPFSFEIAVRMVSFDLLAQILNNQHVKEQNNEINFVVDKIINADTGDEIKLSSNIYEIIAATARETFPNFKILSMNQDAMTNAHYVIIGVMKQEHYYGSQAKFPHLFLSVLDMRSSTIVAHSEVWMSNQNMEIRATPLFSDSPMYLKDARVKALIETALAAAGSTVSKEYFDSLEATALLSEASEAYDAGDYILAVGLFARAADKPDGLTMKTFAGLYQSFLKLQKNHEAEEAFAKLAEIGIMNGNLSIKFLFKVNDTEFFGNPDELSEYQIWIRQIASEIHKANTCVEIIGHASRSGSANYNIKLSQRRAEAIMNKFQKTYPGISKKISALGKGFGENIIGTGTDDMRDAIDRRVEFKIIRCN